MTLALFLMLLTIGATGSGLLTEAVKKWFDNAGRKYSSNIVALTNSIVFGLGGGILAYMVNGVSFTILNVALLIPLILCNWLGCMIGYDKVVQVITQIGKDTK